MGRPPRPWAWCVLSSAVLAASPASRPLSIEQKLLLIAWPASCAWQLCDRAGDQEKVVKTPWPAKLLQLMTALSGLSFFAKLTKDAAVQLPWLPCASLLSLAHMTLPSLELPLGDFIPWWSLLVLGMIATLGSSDMRAEAGLTLGRMDGAPLLWSAICVAISTVALVGWSKIWVRGNHGPIQDALAPLMSPASVLPLAVVNAFREELQFRMMFLGAVLAGDATDSKLLTTISVALHSTFFALLHYLGGFPRGLSGFVLVLIWSLFLDILRIWSGGMALVFLLHVQADVTIFLLVLLEDRRRQHLNQTD